LPLLLAPLLLGTAPSLAAPTSFADFVKAYYDEDYAAHPVSATRAGLHQHDGALDDLTAEGYAHNIARLHKALDALNAMDVKALAPMDRDDREVLTGVIKGQLLDDETIKYWRKDPSRYTRVASGAVFELVHRDFAPLDDRLRAAIAREKAIPALLAAGKANLQHPPKAFIEIALRN